MVAAYRVTIYDDNIRALFNRGEPVNVQAERISLAIVAMAIRLAPVSPLKKPAWGGHPGSENLAARHQRRGYLRAGPYAAQIPIVNTASYARYVHEGTRGAPIAARSGRLWVAASEFLDYRPGPRSAKRAVYGGTPVIRMGHTVRGQGANPWLANAGRLVSLGVR